jgi:hypothetical protein
MLGWNISVYRQMPDHESTGAHGAVSSRTRLAVWQSSAVGLDWLNQLADAGKANCVGNGYPFVFTAKARDIVPVVLSGPPLARSPWTHDPSDILTPQWVGRTIVNEEALTQCFPDELLEIRAWDES